MSNYFEWFITLAYCAPRLFKLVGRTRWHQVQMSLHLTSADGNVIKFDEFGPLVRARVLGLVDLHKRRFGHFFEDLNIARSIQRGVKRYKSDSLSLTLNSRWLMSPLLFCHLVAGCVFRFSHRTLQITFCYTFVAEPARSHSRCAVFS